MVCQGAALRTSSSGNSREAAAEQWRQQGLLVGELAGLGEEHTRARVRVLPDCHCACTEKQQQVQNNGSSC